MPTKKATIIKTKHKGKDVFTLDLGKTRVEARYKSTRNAAVGAVRANKDWCMKNCYDNVVHITYPDGRWRFGSYWNIDKAVHMGPIHPALKKRKSSKAKKA